MVLLKELFDEAIKKQGYTKKSSKNTSQRKKTGESGFYRTNSGYCHSCKDKIIWQYSYFNGNGKRKTISSVDLRKLRDKVQAKGLEWKIENRYYAVKTAKKVGLPLRDLK